MRASHSFNDRFWPILNITCPQIRTESQMEYCCLARREGDAYQHMPTDMCDKEKKFMGTLQCVSYMFYYTNLYCFSTIWQVFRTGLVCPDTPSSWPVRTWLLLPLARCILAQCAWVSYRDFRHKAHRLGQSKRGCCFLLCIVSLLDSFWCQVVTLRKDSGEWDGGESLVFMSALFSFSW